MNIFSDKELKVIVDKCGDEYIKRYRGINKREKDGCVKIVNTGMVSSGKSSLFNVLVDYLEEEYFPTGAARTTTVADYFDYENISFIDTPGIDVRNEDDELAFNTIMEADLIMMVHNIRTGPLNRSEVEWLTKIVGRMQNSEMCKARLMFVCTWKDTREKDEDYINIITDVKKQILNITGIEIPFFEVSVKKYMNGVAKEKEMLKINSGIPELKIFLKEYAKEYLMKKTEMDSREMKILLSEIREQLLKKKDICNELINLKTEKIVREYKSRRGTWKQIYELFSLKRTQLSTLEKEYKNI